MINIEPFELQSIVTGAVRLDVGAMFGVLPKTLWEPLVDVDPLNRIMLATRTLLAVDRAHGRVVLVETGTGTKWDPAEAQRYAVEPREDAIDDALASSGLGREDVTDVVITHLHFDHNGGLTDWVDKPGGLTVPRYAKARHWVHHGHYQHARKPGLKDRASFLLRDFGCLEEAGVLRFVEGNAPDPPFEGCAWLITHGHTPYQLHPVFGTGKQLLLFVGDVIPTAQHLPLPWVMAYDLQPLVTITEKQAIYRRCAKEGLLLAFPHDTSTGGVELDTSGKRPTIRRKLDL